MVRHVCGGKLQEGEGKQRGRDSAGVRASNCCYMIHEKTKRMLWMAV